MHAQPSYRITLSPALLGWWATPRIHLAIPPGYTAPFFPPAGIALAALIVFGLRLWPAVFAGSALIQLATAWPLLGNPGWSLLGPLAVPVGATLQAVVGVLLARRLLAPHDTLDTAGSVDAVPRRLRAAERPGVLARSACRPWCGRA